MSDKCEDCPYSTRFCPPEGSGDEDLLIIGQSPGKNEVLIKPKGPFCGPSGELLNQVLLKVGINRSGAFVTNTVSCRIPDNEIPSDEAIEACESRRVNEIEFVDPNVILALGATASKTILDTDKGIHSLRGKAYQQNGRWIVPTFHPAQCLRVSETFKDFEFDVRKSQKILNNTHEFPDISPNYSVADSCHKLQQACDWIRDNFEVVSCDIETTGLDWKRCNLLAIGFGVDNNRTVIIDWRKIEDTEKAQEKLIEFFKDGPEFIFHNGLYDRKVLEYQYGLKPKIDYDTMPLHHIGLDNRSGRKIRSLGRLAKEYLNVEDWESEFHEEYVEPDDTDMSDAPKDELFRYLSMDVDVTQRLFNLFWGMMDGSLKKAYTKLIQASHDTLAEMEINGMAVDTEHLQKIDEEYSTKLSQARHDLKELADELGFDVEEYVESGWAKSKPDEYFNPDSDQQCQYFYHDVMDLPKFEGEYTARKEARDHYKEKVIGDKADKRKEFIDSHDEFKGLSKLYSTYIKGMWKNIDNGRVHTDYKFVGTRSGRLSSADPNLQNIANQEDVKDGFVASDGHKLMEVDFSQNEIRTLAVLSDDEYLKGVYNRGEDLHSSMAESIFGKDYGKGERYVAKQLNFTLLYGAGPGKVSKQIGCSTKKAKEYIEYWADTAPEAWEYLEELGHLHETQDYIETPFGRRIRFGLTTKQNKHSIINQSKNMPIQGTASDLCLLAANEVCDFLKGLDADLVNMVHDSVIIDYDPDIEEMLVAQLPPIMESTAEEALDSDIPWVADVALKRNSIENSWNELHEISRDAYLSGRNQN